MGYLLTIHPSYATASEPGGGFFLQSQTFFKFIFCLSNLISLVPPPTFNFDDATAMSRDTSVLTIFLSKKIKIYRFNVLSDKKKSEQKFVEDFFFWSNIY